MDVINPIIHALKNHPDATLEEIYNILYMEQDFDDRCKGRI